MRQLSRINTRGCAARCRGRRTTGWGSNEAIARPVLAAGRGRRLALITLAATAGERPNSMHSSAGTPAARDRARRCGLHAARPHEAEYGEFPPTTTCTAWPPSTPAAPRGGVRAASASRAPSPASMGARMEPAARTSRVATSSGAQGVRLPPRAYAPAATRAVIERYLAAIEMPTPTRPARIVATAGRSVGAWRSI